MLEAGWTDEQSYNWSSAGSQPWMNLMWDSIRLSEKGNFELNNCLFKFHLPPTQSPEEKVTMISISLTPNMFNISVLLLLSLFWWKWMWLAASWHKSCVTELSCWLTFFSSLCPVAIIRLDVTFREFSFGLFYWIWETWNIPNNIQHVSSEMVLRRGKLLFWMLSSTVYKFMTSAWYVH